MPVLTPSGSGTSIAWIDWAPRIQLELPECPPYVIAEALRDVAIDFYRETLAWRARDVALTTTVAEQRDYTVTVPSGAALAGLPAVWVDSKEANELAPGQEDDDEPDDTSSTVRVRVTGDDTIIISPAPNDAGLAVVATVAYRPAADATGLLSTRYLEHRDAIEAGALARLMRQQGKAWSNPGDAVARMRDYERLSALFSSRAGPRKRTGVRVRHAL